MKEYLVHYYGMEVWIAESELMDYHKPMIVAEREANGFIE